MIHHLLPHPKTHKKSPFLSIPALLIYILSFLLIQVTFKTIEQKAPGVLGVNSTITIEEVIKYTNVEREKKGLSQVVANPQLMKAAQEKAQNMFSENYWSHYAPSGKDPWYFINNSGYKFAYAGENLARNFSTSSDVVKAWMDSPSHRENILNGKYQEIGIAVVDGVLVGQKTTLVVQMFGRPIDGSAIAQLPEKSEQVSIPVSESENIQGAGFQSSGVKPAVLNPYKVTKSLGIFILGFITSLLVLDLVVLKKRGVYRISSHHFAHISFLILSGTFLFISMGGKIL